MTEFNGKTFQRDGFTLAVTVTTDEYDEPDYLGKFTSEWEEGALDHHRKSRYGSRDHHRWFIPAYSVKECRKDLNDAGHSKAESERLAREQTEANYKRADSLGHEWQYVTVALIASRRGIELGHTSVGGVESDGEDSHFEEIIEDLTIEVLAEANTALDDLLATVHPLDHLAKCAE